MTAGFFYSFYLLLLALVQSRHAGKLKAAKRAAGMQSAAMRLVALAVLLKSGNVIGGGGRGSGKRAALLEAELPTMARVSLNKVKGGWKCDGWEIRRLEALSGSGRQIGSARGARGPVESWGPVSQRRLSASPDRCYRGSFDMRRNCAWSVLSFDRIHGVSPWACTG